MAARCCWLLLLALATRSESLSRSESLRTGRATSMSSSKASMRTTPVGAVGTSASRIDSLARAFASIAVASLVITSSNRSICSHGIAAGAGQEEVGDAREHLVALGIVADRQRTFEFVDQGCLGCHGLLARCSLGTLSHSGNGVASGCARASAGGIRMAISPGAFRHAVSRPEWPTSREKTISAGMAEAADKKKGGQLGRPVDHATRGGTVTGRPRTPPARVCQSL